MIATLTPIDPPRDKCLAPVARSAPPTARTDAEDFWIKVSNRCQWRWLHKTLMERRHRGPDFTYKEELESAWSEIARRFC
jgi:hypothetical protein